MVTTRVSKDRLTTPNLRKRHYPSCSRQESEENPGSRPPKKQKYDHPDFPPARFWDHLSVVHLTQNALRELDRRNTEAATGLLHTSIPEARGPQGVGRFRALPKHLQRFARLGGPDLQDIRGYRMSLTDEDVMSSRSTLPTLRRRKRGSQKNSEFSTAITNTTNTKSIGPYDRGFEQHLIDHNIFPYGYEYPDGRSPPEPENLEEIRQALLKPRASLSPTRFNNDSFRKFERADAQARNERAVTTNVIPILEGDKGDSRCVAGEIPLTNLADLTNGTLVPGNPDIYYGARPEQINRAIRQDLNNHIVPSTQHDLPVAPNYLLQAKGPSGLLSVALRQVSYDGALAARGIHSLQSYKLSEPLYDNKAYTISSLYHAGTLKMFTIHPIPPSAPDEQPAFATTKLGAFAITHDLDAFIQGATAFRNGRDLTQQYRDEAIERANTRAREEATATTPWNNGLVSSFTSGATAEETRITSPNTGPIANRNIPASYESDTSVDELSRDFHPIKRSKPQSPEKRSSNNETARLPQQRGKQQGV